MKRIGLWATGIGLMACVGISTAELGYADEKAPSCDQSSLRGQYAFTLQGMTLGVLDPPTDLNATPRQPGVLHPFASPLPVTAVGQFTFDGHGSFTRVDFNMSNGTPTIFSTTPLTGDDFRTGQTGTYALDTHDADADCTGNMVLHVPTGIPNVERVITIAIAVVGYGQRVFGVVTSEHAPSLPIAPAGTSCPAPPGTGCYLGDNILLELTQNASRPRDVR
jgi:hypothetical protein